MDRDLAIAQLEALAGVPGALRVITNEHACGGGKHPDIAGFDPAACEAYEYSLKDPRHFVIHDVVRLEGPNHRGQYTAYTDEGDYTIGQPEALLARLLEAGAVGAS